ncbi:MAG: TIGR04255 family protein [Candidatus Moranbacteria bacterium]|nr:TIGR04255 family protein [Candidatus Moranbacteria bacterium]
MAKAKKETRKKSFKYGKNYLSKVILRLDFDKIELGSLENFHNDELKKFFPLFAEKKDLEIGLSGDLVSNKISQTRNESVSYVFENSEKTKRFRVGERYVFIEYDKYSNSEELYKDIKVVIDRFILTFGVKTINRLGLRYINEIKLKEPNALDWKNYINKDLLGGLNFSKNEILSRSLSQLVFKKDKGDMSFTYGVFNKEFPSEINIKEFILDFDCHSILPFELLEENILNRIELYHSHIEDLFEKCITQKFRDFLNK